MSDFLLFSGTSNVPLAKQIATRLHVSLGDVEITRFIDNECRIFVRDDVAGKHVYVIESLSEVADQHLVELCLLGQALKSLHAASVTAVIPWMGYSKQDKAFRKGEAVSAQLVAKFIEIAGFNRVITCELHSENVVPYFHIPIVEVSTRKLLAGTLGNILGVVIAPDKGGVSRSERFAKEMHVPVVYLEKVRDLVSGSVSVTGISESVDGKNCIIFDDIINTGATAIKTSTFLKTHGAKKISFLATHGVLAGNAAQQLRKSSIEEIILTDTIAIPKEKQFSEMKIVSVATLLADAIIQK